MFRLERRCHMDLGGLEVGWMCHQPSPNIPQMDRGPAGRCATRDCCRQRNRDCRSEEHTSELQSPCNLVCRLLLEKEEDTSALQSACNLGCRLLLHLQPRPMGVKRNGRPWNVVTLLLHECFFFFFLKKPPPQNLPPFPHPALSRF